MISRVILLVFLIWLHGHPLTKDGVLILLEYNDLVVRMIHHILPQVLMAFYLEGLGWRALTSGS